MSSITYKKATLSNALRISVLLKTVYIQTYAVDGVTDEFAHFITQRFSEERIAQIIKETPHQLLVASLNGNPIGAAEVLYDSTCPIQKIPIAELSKLYVLERFYGQGIGYGLLHEAEKEVLNTGNHLLNLEVYMENHRAIAFYERQGYRSIGTVDFPMETNTYKNLVMRKVLKK